MSYEDYNEGGADKAIWNMDDSVLKTLWYLKNLFIQQKQSWNLDKAYWTLRNIWMESEAKFNQKERDEIAKKINNLEKTRKEFVKDKTNYEGIFYVELEKTYIALNRLMKSNGMFFREGEDDEGL
jgi:hypothetical protein